MAEPNDMIIPMLREMREQIDTRFDQVERRLEKIEGNQRSYKKALVADTMMSKFMVGDFEERIQQLEDKLDLLTKKR